MAIGQRVFVDSAGSRSGVVALADVSGKIVSAVHLADGAEVQVVAWRPRGSNETRYRVQAPHGIDGWLPAENLRSAFVAVPRVEPGTPARAVAESDGRPFGQRRHPERAPEPVRPERVPAFADDGGPSRRFGQQLHPAHASEPVRSEPVPPLADDGYRRFGNQLHPQDASEPVRSEPVRPLADGGGRRFGQH
jgi:hypothetical protein